MPSEEERVEIIKHIMRYIDPLEERIEKLEKQMNRIELKVSNPEWLDVLIMDLIKDKIKEIKIDLMQIGSSQEAIKDMITILWNEGGHIGGFLMDKDEDDQ